MLSSTAKNLYWMGRYLQRAKTTARLIEATQRMALQSRGKEAEGVSRGRKLPKLGYRGIDTGAIAFDDAPVDARLGLVGG